MIKFGLTGGVGMGKSTSADLLRRGGIPVVDSDAIARQVVEPGQPALQEIRQAFGESVIDSDGRLRREKLAELVFPDAAALRHLEAILHPRIRAIWLSQLESWCAEGRASAVAVIPLLFETEATGEFDATICVACSAATQQRRLRARGWTNDQISQRVRVQMSVEKKLALADYVVWTEGDIDLHWEQLQRIAGLTTR